MASKMPPQKIWKRTLRMITLEPIDAAISEIQQNTSWSQESIIEKLFSKKEPIKLPEAIYHIYRDCLG